MPKAKETSAGKKKPASKKAKLTRKERAAAVVTDLKSRYKGKVFLGHEYTAPWLLKRLPTGIPELDIALNGGFPAGGFTMIYGPEGIGKNFLSNCVMAIQQLFLGDDCNLAVVSTEMVFDKTFAKSRGVAVGFSEEEISALARAWEDSTGEKMSDEYKDDLRLEIGTFLTVPPTTAEEAFDIVLELIASRQFDVIVIDSFGSLLTDEDEDKMMEDAVKVGGASAVNTRFARKMNAAFAPDEKGRPNMTCVIGINQVRDNMDRANKYSPKTKETGGWALKHARWVGIELSHGGKLRKGQKGPVIGKTIRWTITKQKAGGHEGASGTYDFIYDLAGVDKAKEVARAALTFGVLEKSGSWISYDGTNLGQGLDKTARALEKQGLLQEIEEAVLEEGGVRCNYHYTPDDD
jgi:recombination protein RecA